MRVTSRKRQPDVVSVSSVSFSGFEKILTGNQTEAEPKGEAEEKVEGKSPTTTRKEDRKESQLEREKGAGRSPAVS